MAAAHERVDAYLSGLTGEVRKLAFAEWGVTVAAEHAGGWPLDIGLRIADGMLTAKAVALAAPEHVDPWMLLWWNRSTRQVRFASTVSHEIWVHADLPLAAVDEQELDRTLGLLVESAVAVRDFERTRAQPAPDPGGGWLDGAGS